MVPCRPVHPQTLRSPTFMHTRREKGISKHSMPISLFSPSPHSSYAPNLSEPRSPCTSADALGPGIPKSGGQVENERHPLGSPTQAWVKRRLFPSSIWGRRGSGDPARCGQPLVRGPWAPPIGQPSPGQCHTAWLWELSPRTMEPFTQPELCTMTLLVDLRG